MPRTQVKGKQIKDDSVTGDDVKEETLMSRKIPFSDASFVSTNIVDAIIEASTGGDPRPSDLITGTITIETNKHHVVMNDLTINGDLVINGTVGII